MANGYFLMIVSLANIMSTTVLLELSEYIQTMYIYITAGSFVLIVSILIATNMKDVILQK